MILPSRTFARKPARNGIRQRKYPQDAEAVFDYYDNTVRFYPEERRFQIHVDGSNEYYLAARVKVRQIKEADFKKWKYQALTKRDECTEGKITVDEYIQWM